MGNYLIKLIIFRKIILYLGFYRKKIIENLYTAQLTFSIVRSVQFNIALKQKLRISSKREKIDEICDIMLLVYVVWERRIHHVSLNPNTHTHTPS